MSSPSIATEVLTPDAAGIARAAAILERGGLCAFPTETVYGLGARADSAADVEAIYSAKGRVRHNPLIVHVADVADARALAARWSEQAERLAHAFWPGPLTLIVPMRAGAVAAAVTAGGDTLALRIPAHPVASALLRACRLPLAAPSANRSTSISPTSAAHVHKTLAGRIDAILDGGSTRLGIESTIVDVASLQARVLRYGALPLAELAAVVPVLDRGEGVTTPGERAPSPGTSSRHYAPRARLEVAPADQLAACVVAARARAASVGTLELGERPSARSEGAQLREALPGDPAAYAAALYALLHRFDDAGCDVVVAEAVPDSLAWVAVRDRLRRASTPD